MKSVKPQISNQARDQVWDQVRAQVDDQVFQALLNLLVVLQ